MSENEDASDAPTTGVPGTEGQPKAPVKPNAEEHQEPSIGPACLVVVILTLAVFCSVCAFGSWFMFSDQYPLAERGVDEQLIPWVETSQLAAEDKNSIVDQLHDIVAMLHDRSIDKRQLSRLRNCLQDNPILLWGGVQSIVAQSKDVGLTGTEVQAVERISQRLMRMGAERKLGRNDLEFTLQHCSKVREDQLSVEVRSNLTADEIREFMRRAEQLVQGSDVPNEPYESTAAEAFAKLVKMALDVDNVPGEMATPPARN
ncbi:hypothetical protein [Aureliella helgolandensis]|uniref:Uncharacterized protein n=1 Tax=Aureliella helgolandensis TaxID=2527968 RepID=A0A518G026_9BACT|nr:hypothetical protein [Aureliella helgolandensis]QDV21943.1 hypothetical protein Q31a_02220 [Aureliella helgolandensis]